MPQAWSLSTARSVRNRAIRSAWRCAAPNSVFRARQCAVLMCGIERMRKTAKACTIQVATSIGISTRLRSRIDFMHALLRLVFLVLLLLLSACAVLPPGSGVPKPYSTALSTRVDTALGSRFAGARDAHPDASGLAILSVGMDGFLTRAQLIMKAERAIDLQYYIFREDDTGELLSELLLKAADRGVRVRLLVDDGDTVEGDEKLALLAAHPSIEVRIFNPFRYRGHLESLRFLEFAMNPARLDFRMHNKLMVVDNAVALVGGRNVGKQYFQLDPDSQFGDDDVFAAGPVVERLSATFDEFWNSDLAIPSALVTGCAPSTDALTAFRTRAQRHRAELIQSGAEYARRIEVGEPLASLLGGTRPLIWAHTTVLSDSPDKRRVEKGQQRGRLMHQSVLAAAAKVQQELLMISPYFIPGDDGMALFTDLRQREVRVQILTNSLSSNPEVVAHAGYAHFRPALLDLGLDLFEVRSLLGNPAGSGERKSMTRFGTFALHAKIFVFDRKSLFMGSMNFDQRSRSLNTEVGLIIDSPELAEQMVRRFQALTRPENSFQVQFGDPGSDTRTPRSLVWKTQEDGKVVVYQDEPARSAWQRWKFRVLSIQPLDQEL